MTDFRSKKDGSHYPIHNGEPVYPNTTIDESRYSKLDMHVLIRSGDFVLQKKTFPSLERIYNLYWFTYEDKNEQIKNITKEEFIIGDTSHPPHVSIRPGHNEGYIVEIEVFDEKTMNHVGWLRAKLFDKQDAIQFTNDLWNLKRIQ